MVQRIANFLERLGKHGTDKWFIGGKREIHRKLNEPYMTRYYLLSTPYLGIYIHQFWASDYPVCHDHPWPFISIPFGDGYLEHLADGSVLDRGIKKFVIRSANDLHWVELKKPGTWSLFIRFKVMRNWGFLTPQGWIRYDRYDAEIQRLRDEQNHN